MVVRSRRDIKWNLQLSAEEAAGIRHAASIVGLPKIVWVRQVAMAAAVEFAALPAPVPNDAD